jgi:phosphatidate phosphatase APP1
VPYTGYGTDGWVRVLARVVLVPPDASSSEVEDTRGWRAFLSASASEVPVSVRIGGETHTVDSLRDGYVDVRLPARLPDGWGSAELSVEGMPSVEAPLRIVGASAEVGLLSDIDDTVMVTMLPRPLLAFRNAFLLKASARRPVPGMAELYREIAAARPDLVVVYLSTGAWNTAPTIRSFLDRHGYPPGPLLLSDWGPTREGWFRSGAAHKRHHLRRLMQELPHVRWLLVGDDGQHDPTIYAEAASAAPESVVGVAIRQLSTTEQVLKNGSPLPADGAADPPPLQASPHVRAPDGYGLRDELRNRGILIRHP